MTHSITLNKHKKQKKPPKKKKPNKQTEKKTTTGKSKQTERTVENIYEIPSEYIHVQSERTNHSWPSINTSVNPSLFINQSNSSVS